MTQRTDRAGYEELLDLLDLERGEEFTYFENFADLMELDEEIEEDAFFSLLRRVPVEPLGEFIETYLEDAMDSLPDEAGAEVYAFLLSVKMMLLGLCEKSAAEDPEENGGEERGRRRMLGEELYRFRQWYKSESRVGLRKQGDARYRPVPLLEAVTTCKIEKLGEEEYEYDFDLWEAYRLDEYIVSCASLAAAEEDGTEEAYDDGEDL